MILLQESTFDLEESCLELSVYDHDRFSSNDLLGTVQLNLGRGKLLFS